MAEYTPFKMKGHTLPGIKQRPSKKMADGRASSSPFQTAGHTAPAADGHQHLTDEQKLAAANRRKEEGISKRMSKYNIDEKKATEIWTKQNPPLPQPKKKSPAKAHEPGHTKEIKGTSIFGKSPKEFVKGVFEKTPTGRVYKKAKEVYKKYKTGKNKPNKAMKQGFKEGITEGTQEIMGMRKVGKKLVKDSMKPAKRGKRMRETYGKMKKEMKPIEKKRTMTDKTEMRAPYKKPVGPRAN